MTRFRYAFWGGLVSLTLLAPACQQTISEATQMSPTFTPNRTSTTTPALSPTPTPSATATPTSGVIRQGDQLPTRIPSPPPTPTAIPVGEAAPTPTNTYAPLPTGTPVPSAIDLLTLDESLALLDRLDRREGEAAPALVGPIIFEGSASWTDNIPGECPCPECNGSIFTANVLVNTEGSVSGILKSPGHDISFGSKPEFMVGETTFVNNDGWHVTRKFKGKLADANRKFEGSVEEIFNSHDECNGIWTFSLSRK